MAEFVTFSIILLAILFIALLFFLGKIIKIEVAEKLAEIHGTISGYRKHSPFMDPTELAFFIELKKVLPQNYHLFSKVRVADIIDAIEGPGYISRTHKIFPRHVDFLICSYQMDPILAIEVDGASHTSIDRVARDQEMDAIYKSAGLDLKHVRTGKNFSVVCSEIVRILPRIVETEPLPSLPSK